MIKSPLSRLEASLGDFLNSVRKSVTSIIDAYSCFMFCFVFFPSVPRIKPRGSPLARQVLYIELPPQPLQCFFKSLMYICVAPGSGRHGPSFLPYTVQYIPHTCIQLSKEYSWPTAIAFPALLYFHMWLCGFIFNWWFPHSWP